MENEIRLNEIWLEVDEVQREVGPGPEILTLRFKADCSQPKPPYRQFEAGEGADIPRLHQQLVDALVNKRVVHARLAVQPGSKNERRLICDTLRFRTNDAGGR